MTSSRLALGHDAKRPPRLSCILLSVAGFMLSMSTGCKATCRDGQFLRGGLCHSPDQPPVDAGGDGLDSGDQASGSGDSGSGKGRTGAQTQAASGAEAGADTETRKDASVSERDSAGSGGTDRDAGMSSTMNEPATSTAECGNGVREGTELCDGTDCKTECTSDNACIRSQLVGAAKTCDAQCKTTETTACSSGDGCCPNGCDHGTDGDCSPSCGDGVLTGTETCEPGSSTYPCATAASCNDNDPCTTDTVTGNAQQCSAKCANAPITRRPVDCDDNDPCTDDAMVESATECAFECTHSEPRRPTGSCEDSDPCTDDTPEISATRCAYECPHRRLQPTAASCEDNNPCTDDTPAMSESRCAFECPHDPAPSGTPCGNGMMCNASGRCEAAPARCGDGVLTPPEECDPAAPGQVAGYSCNSSCRRLNKLTACNGDNQCEGSPAGRCDIPGICRPFCSMEGALCDILPGATQNQSQCIAGACAYLCSVYEGVDPEHCGPTLWCDGTYCRVKP
jgi:hypothetical protein